MTRSSTDVVAIRRTRRTDAAGDVLAAWRQGQAVMVFEGSTSDDAVARALSMVRPAVLVHERPDGARRLTRLPDPRPLPDAAAAIVLTSGTTGAPSAIVIGEAALEASTVGGLARLGATAEERWALSLPLDHVAGLLVLKRGESADREVELHDGFDPADLVRGDATWWALVPTMLHRLLRRDEDLAGRRVLLGGAPATTALLDHAAARGIEVVTSYGMTETCGGCVYDGVPLDGVDVVIDPDTSRISIRGPVLATARLDADGAVAPLVDPEGWHQTNDLGRWEDGKLVVIGRCDDVVVTGGVNVSIGAIERTLRAYPDIMDVAVIAVPDDQWGERIEAFLVTAAPDPNLWRARLRQELGREAVPARFHVVGDLPRTRLGKPDRTAMSLTASL